jgi:hypothetical protein
MKDFKLSLKLGAAAKIDVVLTGHVPVSVATNTTTTSPTMMPGSAIDWELPSATPVTFKKV